MKYYNITNFKTYPCMYVSNGVMKAVKKDGLIVPLLLISDHEIHETSIERFEAFRRIASGIKDGAKTIIGIEISELSEEELTDEGLK